ncbi:MAG: hypothetical protein JWQ87_5490 [Candidatus Sulfotelmatobacter sp.]|nr:hypothetical protein [Candidatus Sulfotelmatobacter sp.]
MTEEAKMTWKHWLINFGNAAVSGACGGILSAGLGIGWHKAMVVAGGCGFVSAVKWYFQHKPPGVDPE